MTQKERAKALISYINNQFTSSMPALDALKSEVLNGPDGSVDGQTLKHFCAAAEALETFRANLLK